jgi:dethiobiotin synthetase
VRPGRLIVVTGTGTEVGKTWVTAAVARQAGALGLTVAARKAVQSFDPPGPQSAPTDAALLAAATGEPADIVCPRRRSYPLAMAPPMAAAALGIQPPSLADLAGELTRSWPADPVDLGLIEGAGGVASPLAADGHTADLARVVEADGAILVADPSLGVINAVRLSAAALAPLSIAVHLNRYNQEDDLHRRNHEWLQQGDHFLVTTDVMSLLDAILG